MYSIFLNEHGKYFLPVEAYIPVTSTDTDGKVNFY